MNNTARITLVITGAISALVATALVVGGLAALWGDSQKDSDGYLTTNSQRFEADTRALASESLDVDLGDADWLAQTNDLGNLKVTAESRDDRPLFVGLARTSDVERYLNGVPHTTVDDIEVSPFEADYTRHRGNTRPSAPQHADIWEASSHGNGEQSIEWEVEDGDYSVVVMNADGSLGVDADISAGADIPFLEALGWSAIGSGAFALVLSAGLIVLGVRRPRRAAPIDGTAPAAA